MAGSTVDTATKAQIQGFTRADHVRFWNDRGGVSARTRSFIASWHRQASRRQMAADYAAAAKRKSS